MHTQSGNTGFEPDQESGDLWSSLHLDCGHGPDRWACPVDEIRGVFRFCSTEIAPAPATVSKAPAHLTRGVLTDEGTNIALLDGAQVVDALGEALR